MIISETVWKRYSEQLGQISETAARKMREFLENYDISQDRGRKQLMDMAYALATRYGDGAAELACRMYDAIAESSGAEAPAAEPAPASDYGEVAKAVNGTLKNRTDIMQTAETVGRLVKQSGQDTTLRNALRDGAEFAWIPHGDTCAFCMMLASNGWQKMSETALKHGHAEHIHANCDCAYAIRFDRNTDVAGYDPDKYRKIYEAAEGDTWQEKLNSMRREQNADKAGGSPRKADMGKPSEDGTVRSFAKTVGARLFMSDIFDFETGMTYHIREGKPIRNVKVFAGKGAKKPYYKAYKYADKVGGRPEDWKHVKGIAYIENEFESGLAAIHWSEHDELGSYDPFVKKWL